MSLKNVTAREILHPTREIMLAKPIAKDISPCLKAEFD